MCIKADAICICLQNLIKNTHSLKKKQKKCFKHFIKVSHCIQITFPKIFLNLKKKKNHCKYVNVK